MFKLLHQQTVVLDIRSNSALVSGTVAVTSSTLLETINFPTLELNEGTYHAVISSTVIDGRWYVNDHSVTVVG